MRKSWIITTLALLLMSTALLLLDGCNTWHGAGKDVERAGEKMQ